MGQKFRLRAGCGFRYIRGDKITNDLVVDSDEPGFKSQKHKFEDTPIAEAVAQTIVETAKKAEIAIELGDTSKMKRPELIELFTTIAGKAPPETVKAVELKQILELVRDGMDINEALVEICGDVIVDATVVSVGDGAGAASHGSATSTDSASGV